MQTRKKRNQLVAVEKVEVKYKTLSIDFSLVFYFENYFRNPIIHAHLSLFHLNCDSKTASFNPIFHVQIKVWQYIDCNLEYLPLSVLFTSHSKARKQRFI